MAALLVGILIWAPVRPVSAKEVLSKEISIDTGRQSITSQQVVRQRVRIRKTSTGSAGERVAALESWKSTRSAYWKSKSDPVNTELLDQYKANGLASSLPLSPTAVESWARVAGSEPSASREGQNIFVQVVSNPAGQARGLKEVSFRVKTADWHMDQMTLSFADATFQISEEESSILDKHEIPTEVLNALEPTAEDPLRTSMPRDIGNQGTGSARFDWRSGTGEPGRSRDGGPVRSPRHWSRLGRRNRNCRAPT